MTLYSKQVFLTLLFSLLALSFVPNITASAAVFLPTNSKDVSTVEINKSEENLYVSSQTVKINAPIRKDLVVSGSTVEINSPVERSIMAAGGTVKINSSSVGAAVRVAGGKVEISGTFDEDVIIAGGMVTIKNAKIRGDLVVSAGNLVVQDSKINGKFIGSYGQIDGSLKDQVVSQNISTTVFDTAKNKDTDGAKWFWRIGAEISTILGLSLIVYFLAKRKRLAIDEILPNTKFGLDILSSIGYLILPIFVFIISAVFQIYTLAATLWAMLILGMILSNIFLPIYMANFFKNTFKLNFSLVYLVFGVYFVMVVLSVIPGINVIAGLIMFIFFLANFGFLARKFFATLNNSLKTKE